MTNGRLRHRQGAVRLIDGIPYANRDTTLSLLPGAAVGRWLGSRSQDICGYLLDLGAGNRPYADWYGPLATRVTSIDAAPIPGLDAVGFGAQLPFRDASFDSILCTSVLEHVDDAEKALSEMVRVLRPGGRVLVTVPFLYPLHEAPYDYWRMTHIGLRSALERHGLIVDDVAAQGGPILFAVHYVVLAIVHALEMADSRLHRFRWLLANRLVNGIIAGPQELVRGSVRYTLSSLARIVSLGYMAAAHLEEGTAGGITRPVSGTP